MLNPRSASFALVLALGACSSVETAPAGTHGEMGGDDTDETSDSDDAATDAGTDGDTSETLDVGGAQACDPWAQDCPTGEKCTYHYDGYETVTRCVALEPNAKASGEPCQVDEGQWSGLDNCGVGLVCHYVNEQGFGICVEMCGGSPDDPTCSDPESMCQLCNNDCASLCLPTCDPLMPECGEAQVCTPTNEGAFVCTPGDVDNGVGEAGKPCEYANECGNGFACVPAESVPGCDSGFCCAAYCDLSLDKPDCPDQLVCTPWHENPPAEHEDVGVCTSG